MAATSLLLSFRKIFEAMSAYGSEYEDVSRAGIDGHRQKYIGKRGKRSTVTAISFHRDRGSADIAKRAYEAAKGQEAIIKSELDLVQYQVFIHDVLCQPPKLINSTERDITYRVSVQLEVTRTVA